MNFVKYMVHKVRAFGVSQLLAIQQECGQREESTQCFLPLSKLWPTSQHSAVDWSQNMSLGEMNVFRQQGMEKRVGISTDAHHRPNTDADGTSFPWAFCPQISKDSNSGSMEGMDDGLPYIFSWITSLWSGPVSLCLLYSFLPGMSFHCPFVLDPSPVFFSSFLVASHFSGAHHPLNSEKDLWEAKCENVCLKYLYFVLMFDC